MNQEIYSPPNRKSIFIMDHKQILLRIKFKFLYRISLWIVRYHILKLKKLTYVKKINHELQNTLSNQNSNKMTEKRLAT
jgi:hypothetical protein